MRLSDHSAGAVLVGSVIVGTVIVGSTLVWSVVVEFVVARPTPSPSRCHTRPQQSGRPAPRRSRFRFSWFRPRFRRRPSCPLGSSEVDSARHTEPAPTDRSALVLPDGERYISRALVRPTTGQPPNAPGGVSSRDGDNVAPPASSIAPVRPSAIDTAGRGKEYRDALEVDLTTADRADHLPPLLLPWRPGELRCSPHAPVAAVRWSAPARTRSSRLRVGSSSGDQLGSLGWRRRCLEGCNRGQSAPARPRRPPGRSGCRACPPG